MGLWTKFKDWYVDIVRDQAKFFRDEWFDDFFGWNPDRFDPPVNPLRDFGGEGQGIIPAQSLYGTKKVVGHLCWRSPNQRVLYFIRLISEGACESLEGIQRDGVPVTFTTSTDENIDSGETRIFTPTGRDHNGHPYLASSVGEQRMVVYECFKADGTQGTFIRDWTSHLPNNDPIKWTVNHRLTGISFIAGRLWQNTRVDSSDEFFFQNNPNIEYVVKGRKITWPGQTTPTWTDNAACVWYDIMTKLRSIPPSFINETEFEKARLICEQSITRTLTQEQIDSGLVATRRRYTFDGLLDTNTDWSQFDLDFNFIIAGSVNMNYRQLTLRAGTNPTGTDLPSDPNTTVPLITDIDIYRGQPVLFYTMTPLHLTVNTLHGNMLQSIDKDYAERDLGKISDPHTLAEDTEIREGRSIVNLPYTNDPLTARMLLRIALRRERMQRKRAIITIIPDLDDKFLLLKSGDLVRLDLSDSEKLGERAYEIQETTLNADGTITMILWAFYPDTYNDDDGFSPLEPSRVIPVTPRIPKPTNVQFSIDTTPQRDGTVIVRVTITWDDTIYPVRTRIRYNRDDSTIQELDLRTPNNYTFTPPESGTFEFSVQHETSDGNQTSGYTDWQSTGTIDIRHPNDLINFRTDRIGAGQYRFSAQSPNNRDYAGMLIYIVKDSNDPEPPSDHVPISVQGIPSTTTPAVFNVTSFEHTFNDTGRFRCWARPFNRAGEQGNLTNPIDLQIGVAGGTNNFLIASQEIPRSSSLRTFSTHMFQWEGRDVVIEYHLNTQFWYRLIVGGSSTKTRNLRAPTTVTTNSLVTINYVNALRVTTASGTVLLNPNNARDSITVGNYRQLNPLLHFGIDHFFSDDIPQQTIPRQTIVNAGVSVGDMITIEAQNQLSVTANASNWAPIANNAQTLAGGIRVADGDGFTLVYGESFISITQPS